MNLQPLNTPSTSGALLAELGSAADAGSARQAGALATPGDGLVDAAAPAALAAAKTSRTTTSGARKTSGSGYAKAKSSSSTTKKKASTTSKATATSVPKDLAFLSDPKLSVEEKLFRFMQYFSAKYDEQIQAKMNEIAGKQPKTSTSSTKTTTAKKKGLLGKLGSVVKKFLPAVGVALDALQSKTLQSLLKQVSGPVLAAGATALGFPQLAPVLLKAGPEVASALGTLAKELDDGAETATAKKTSSSSTSKSSSSSSSAGSQELSQADAMELQRLQDKQKEMFTLVSNLLRAMHDTKMAVINNVRS